MAKEQSLWFLENIDVSGIFCPKKLGRGDMDNHKHKKYKKGEYVYLPQEDADKVYFIAEGRVKIGYYADDDSDRQITKAVLSAGEVFGELSLVGEAQRRDFAYVMEETNICVLSVKDMESLMREHNGFSLFMMNILGSRVLEMEKRLESLVFKDSRTRIIEFLRELAEKKGRQIGYEREVRKFFTHQEIANLTATSRQTVTTVLNELRNKNVLTFNRRRMLVRDMEKLAAEAIG